MKEFRRRYGLIFLPLIIRIVETVITRMYFLKRNSCTEQMSLVEFRNSPFLDLLYDLEKTADINAVYFVVRL